MDPEFLGEAHFGYWEVFRFHTSDPGIVQQWVAANIAAGVRVMFVGYGLIKEDYPEDERSGRHGWLTIHGNVKSQAVMNNRVSFLLAENIAYQFEPGTLSTIDLKVQIASKWDKYSE